MKKGFKLKRLKDGYVMVGRQEIKKGDYYYAGKAGFVKAERDLGICDAGKENKALAYTPDVACLKNSGLPKLLINENLANENELENFIKPFIHEEVKKDGQSDKYFKNLWLMWWGMMGTSVKNGLVKAFKEAKGLPDLYPMTVWVDMITENEFKIVNGFLKVKDIVYEKAELEIKDSFNQ